MTGEVPAPGQLPPLLDAGNRLLSAVPCNMVIGKLPGQDGDRGILTIRTPDVTLTLVLDRAEIGNWIGNLARLCDLLAPPSSLAVPTLAEAARIAAAREAR